MSQPKMKIAYVSGKMTDARGAGFEWRHAQQAREIAEVLWSLGIAALCPHTLAFMMQGMADYETFMEGDMRFVEVSDLLVMVPNWYDSSGAKREQARARTLSKPIYYWPYDFVKIVEHCHPDGLPQRYYDKAKVLLPDRIAEVKHLLIQESE